MERRTETTRTFATDSGAYQTVFYDAPVNYRDANGAWQATTPRWSRPSEQERPCWECHSDSAPLGTASMA